jgi:hypothetical protein
MDIRSDKIERSLTKIVDVDLKILSELDDRSLLTFCTVSKYGRELCRNESLWEKRINSKYPDSLLFKQTGSTWREYYLKITYYLDKYNEDLYRAFREAAKRGDRDIISLLIKRGIKGVKSWNEGLAGATEGGRIGLIKFFIKKGADDWNEGMISAAYAGNEELVKYFIEKGDQEWNFPMYWQGGLDAAILGGNKKLIDLFISKGAKMK